MKTLMRKKGNSRFGLNRYNVILTTCVTFCGIFFMFNDSALPYSQGCLSVSANSSERRNFCLISFVRIQLPKQSELFCVLESVVEVPCGHIEHPSCALNSWYDPIGQSLHFPVALSK